MPVRDTDGLTAAVRALDLEKRPPTEADRPPLETFPMTPAARESVRLSKKRWPKKK